MGPRVGSGQTFWSAIAGQVGSGRVGSTFCQVGSGRVQEKWPVDNSERDLKGVGEWRVTTAVCGWAGRTSWLYGENIRNGGRYNCCTEVTCKLVKEFCIVCVCVILSLWSDLRRGVMWWNFGVFVTARAAELRTSWSRLSCWLLMLR